MADTPDNYADIYSSEDDPQDMGFLYDENAGVEGSGSPTYDKFLAANLGTIRSAGDPDRVSQEVVAATDEIKTTTPETADSYVQRASQMFLRSGGFDVHFGQIAQSYQETGDPKHIQNASDFTQEVGSPSAKDNIRAGFKAASAAYSDVEKEVIANQWMLATMIRYMEAHGIEDNKLHTIEDFAGGMVSWDTVRNLWKGDGLSVNAGITQKSRDFSNLSPEEKVVQFLDVLDYVYKIAGDHKEVFGRLIAPYLNMHDIEEFNNESWTDAGFLLSSLPITKILKVGKAALTGIKNARAAGDFRRAGKMTADVLMDTTGNTAKATGTERVDAAISSMPFGGEGVFVSATDGVNVAAQQAIDAVLNPIREKLNNIINNSDVYVKRSALKDEEAALAQKKAVDKYAGRAKVVEEDEDGFTLEVDIATPPPREPFKRTDIPEGAIWDGGEVYPEEPYKGPPEPGKPHIDQRPGEAADGFEVYPTTEKVRVVYTKNDIGKFDSTEIRGAVHGKVSSAQPLVGQLDKDVVNQVGAIERTQQDIRTYLEDVLSTVVSGISKKSRKTLNAILLQGDKDGIARYSNHDLMTGIMTADGFVRFDNLRDVIRYHASRDAFDTIWHLQNSRTAKELAFQGYNRSIVNDKEIIGFIKGDGGLETIPKDVDEYYNATTRKVEKASKFKKQPEGTRLYKLKTPYEYKSGRKVEFVAAGETDKLPMPKKVLNYRPGYVPRMHKNIFFVAIKHGTEKINGKSAASVTVKRYFDSQKEALAWQKFQIAKKPKLAGRLEIRSGKEYLNMTPGLKEDYEASLYGGMFRGQRAEQTAKFGTAGVEPEHVGALQALDAALNNVSIHLPMTEFRMGLIQRFINSAKNEQTGASLLSNPGDWRSPLTNIDPRSPQAHGLEAMRTWMQDVFRMKTSEERGFERLMYSMGSFFDNENPAKSGIANTFRKWTMNLGDKDIYAAARAASFHALLGWFNPRQLLVQAASASVAFSMDPIKAPKLMARYMALRAVMYSDKKVLDMMAHKALEKGVSGLRDQEFAELARAFRKSGTAGSVKNTADYDAAIHGFGTTNRAFRGAANMGLWFFREGELIQRTYAWLLAHDNFVQKAAKEGRKITKLTDKEIDAITKESYRYTMNLQRANRAYWQKGILSIPLQFQQVSAKFIENMMYSQKSGMSLWTGADKIKILLGSIVLFGSAGLPFGKSMVQHIATWLKDDGDYGPAVTNPDALAWLNGGAIEDVLYRVLGSPVHISQDLSLPGNLENLLSNFTRTDVSYLKKIQGAAGAVADRSLQALMNISTVFAANVEEDNDWSMLDVETSLIELGDIISAFRNIHKSHIMLETQQLWDSKNNPIGEIESQHKWPLVIAQAMGMQPQEFTDSYAHANFVADTKATVAEVVEARMKIIMMAAANPNRGDPAVQRKYEAWIDLIQRKLTDEQKRQVADIISERLQENNYKLTKQIQEKLKLESDLEGNTPGLELSFQTADQEGN